MDTTAAILKNAIIGAVGYLAGIVIWIEGKFISLTMWAIIHIAPYNNFINEESIIEAWVIVRDFCNMFFILILLLIAFASILQYENYSIKRLLPKLILMAILINFSRMICGIIIDAGQIVMLTFVSAFADGGGNFAQHLGIDKYLSMVHGTQWTADVSLFSTLGALGAAIVVMAVAAVVMVVLLCVLMIRIVMIWIYIVLSPLAFLLSAFPGGQKYAAQWWRDFTTQVVAGPLLAFFIWLALITSAQVKHLSGADISTLQCFGPNEILCPGEFINFLVAIGMLVGGLAATSKLGGAIGAAAGKGIASIHKGKALAWGGTKLGAFKAGRFLDTKQTGWQEKIANKVGLVDYKPKSLNYRAIAQGWRTKKAKDMQIYDQQVGRSDVWADNFNKYLSFAQIGAIRKNKKRIIKDETEATQIDKESKLIQRRKNYAGWDEDRQVKALEKYRTNETKITDAYSNNANPNLKKVEKEKWAKEQYDDDINALTFGKQYNTKELDDKIKENEEEVTRLTDHTLIGLHGDKYKPYDFPFSKGGMEEAVDKQESETNRSTRGQDFAVINEWLTAYQEKDETKMSATLRILAKNNDLNELAKDPRVIRLMTKQNGLLEKLNSKGMFKNEDGLKLDPGQLESLKQGVRANPVSPAHIQALVQGAFESINVDDSKAARHANLIGGNSIAAGNGVGYAMSVGDVATGNFEFSKYKFEKERGVLETTEGRNAAVAGKMANIEPQQKMRTFHPDTLFAEGSDGELTYVHEMGKESLKSFTYQDLEHISRIRSDNITKIKSSPHIIEEIVKIAKEVQDAGDIQQAKIIKKVAGHLKAKIEGGGVVKSSEAAEEAIKDLAKKYELED
ncbi:hypothetical protein KAR28_03585 [Candidatus Parcubacteria bacterium]|nr:hypothetical protein [Candidatus Parcubacteria bacterium]